MKPTKAALALAALILLPSLGGQAQAAGTAQTPSAGPAAGKSDLAFTRTILGRFETIAVGSFPIAFFYVGIGFDLGTYFSHNFDPLYAPWPFKDDRAPAPSDSDKRARIIGAALFSLGIATLDALLRPGADQRRRVARGTEAFPQPPAAPGEGTSLPLPSASPGGGSGGVMPEGSVGDSAQTGTGAQLDSNPSGE